MEHSSTCCTRRSPATFQSLVLHPSCSRQFQAWGATPEGHFVMADAVFASMFAVSEVGLEYLTREVESVASDQVSKGRKLSLTVGRREFP